MVTIVVLPWFGLQKNFLVYLKNYPIRSYYSDIRNIIIIRYTYVSKKYLVYHSMQLFFSGKKMVPPFWYYSQFSLFQAAVADTIKNEYLCNQKPKKLLDTCNKLTSFPNVAYSKFIFTLRVLVGVFIFSRSSTIPLSVQYTSSL